MSNIDPTVPVPRDHMTGAIQDNFAIAKAEIEALDGRVGELELAGGGGGPIGDVEIGGTLVVDGDATFRAAVILNQDPTAPLEAATQQYVDTAVAPLSAKADVTGSRSDGSALASLLTTLAAAGMITDSTTA